jgi:predicted P-loop ATPase
MPLFNLNLSEAESLKPVSEGAHTFVVDSFDGPKKTTKGKMMLSAIARVQEGSDEDGRKVYINLMLEGKGAGITAAFLSAVLGEEIDVDNTEQMDEIDTDDLIGQEFDGIVKHSEYPEGSGEMRANVVKFKAS